MTSDELFSILRPHIIALTGVPMCIKYAQNQDAPHGEYAVINPRYATAERGQANIKRSNAPLDTIKTEIKVQAMVTVAVEFFRGDAHGRAQSLLQAGKNEGVTWDLFKYKISIRNTGGVLDLTSLQSSNYESRARIELYLWMEIDNSYTVNNILHSSVSVENEEGMIIQSSDFDLR